MKIKKWVEQHPTAQIQFHLDDSMETVVDKAIAHPVQSDFYVLDEHQVVVGYLSLNKIATILLAAHHPTQTRREILDRVAVGLAKDVMTKHFSYCRIDEDIDDVLHRFTEHNIRALPILDNENKLLGYIDLINILQAAQQNEF